MTDVDFSVLIPGCTGVGAGGLYVLLRSRGERMTPPGWAAAAASAAAAGVLAAAVLQPTGSFWRLLLLSLSGGGALMGAGAAGTVKGAEISLRWGCVALVGAAGVLLAGGGYWTGGLLALLGGIGGVSFSLRRPPLEETSDEPREPALCCLMCWLLGWGLLSATAQDSTWLSPERSDSSAAVVHNQLVFACGLFSLGALQAVAWRDVRRSLSGVGLMLAAAMIPLSAAHPGGEGEIVALVVLAVGALEFALFTVRRRTVAALAPDREHPVGGSK